MPTLVLGLVTVASAGFAGIARGSPTVFSPLPAATIIPTFWLAMHVAPQNARLVELILPALVRPLLLTMWYARLLVGANQVPRRSLIGLTVLSFLTIVDFAFEWRHAFTYHTATYVHGVAAVNAVSIGFAWMLLYRAVRARTFVATLIAHVWIVAWLVWLAFPWLGELI